MRSISRMQSCAEAEVLMTTDKGFPLETEVDGVWVGKPYCWGPATLFDDRDD